MANWADNGVCTRAVSRTVLVVFCVCLVGFTMRLIWYKPLKEQSVEAQRPCPQCLCDCSSESLFPIIQTGFHNSSLAGSSLALNAYCGKDVPELNEEMRKDLMTLMIEELDLHKTVANETLDHTDALISHARTASLHYQREAEKCNAGVETCEEARERAEAQLVEERRLSALWEERARELGWEYNRRLYS